MAIVRPTTKTLISTTNWGIPITDEVNRLTPLVDNKTPTAWVPITLMNGWTNFDANAYGVLAYRKIGDIVYMRGAVAGGTGDICNLPVAARPAKHLSWAIAGVQANPAIGNTAQVAIFSTGNIYPYDCANSIVHFGHISWSQTP
jgi:hypothetical protein